ncbi:MAG: alpha/beta hydrolase [Pseudomonadota bacterium]
MKPVAKWAANARRFTFQGWPIAYWTSRGKPDLPLLLLIHGYPTSSWDWTALWPALKGRFRLAALDMLGFGLSAKPRKHVYEIAQQADLQEALLEHLGEGAAHILAHDYGVTVAQELLARENEGALSFAIRSVCFLNGGLFPEAHRPRPLQKLAASPLGPLVGLLMTKARFSDAFAEVFGPDAPPSAEELDGHWRLITEGGGKAVMHKLLRYMVERRANRARWVGALSATRAPLHLISGAADPVSGRSVYDAFPEHAPDAGAVSLDGVGHYPHTEAPAAVAEAFFAFHDAFSDGPRSDFAAS